MYPLVMLTSKRAILATVYRQHLRIGPITPKVRIGIKNLCVGGSIPPQATRLESLTFFSRVGLFSWWSGRIGSSEFGLGFGGFCRNSAMSLKQAKPALNSPKWGLRRCLESHILRTHNNYSGAIQHGLSNAIDVFALCWLYGAADKR